MVIVLVLAKYSLGIVLLFGLVVASGEAKRRHKALAQQPLCHPAHPLNRRARANLQSALCFTMVMMVMMMMMRRMMRIFCKVFYTSKQPPRLYAPSLNSRVTPCLVLLRPLL